MARLPYASRETASAEAQALFDTLEARRGRPIENIFLMLAREPHLCEAVLGLASALRTSTLLDRRYRELAVLTVGVTTGASYEVDHHWNPALRAGVTPAQLAALADFETSELFDGKERTVMRYAREVTGTGTTTDATWAGLSDFLDPSARLELALTVAWYNCVARLILPLQIEREAWLSVERELPTNPHTLP